MKALHFAYLDPDTRSWRLREILTRIEEKAADWGIDLDLARSLRTAFGLNDQGFLLSSYTYKDKRGRTYMVRNVDMRQWWLNYENSMHETVPMVGSQLSIQNFFYAQRQFALGR